MNNCLFEVMRVIRFPLFYESLDEITLLITNRRGSVCQTSPLCVISEIAATQ